MKLILIRRSLVTAVACALAAAVIFFAVSMPSIAAARLGTDVEEYVEQETARPPEP